MVSGKFSAKMGLTERSDPTIMKPKQKSACASKVYARGWATVPRQIKRSIPVRAFNPLPPGDSPPRLAAKFFLQDCLTGKFMRLDSAWTTDIGEAFDFLSAKRAIFFGMKELRVSFRIMQSECDVLWISDEAESPADLLNAPGGARMTSQTAVQPCVG